MLAALSGVRRFLGVVLVIVLVGGLGVRLAAPAHSMTEGASGVVFGLFGYPLVRGFVDRRAGDMVMGVLVAVVYGSLLWDVLPTAAGTSWQGYLFGQLGGVAAASALRRTRDGGRARGVTDRPGPAADPVADAPGKLRICHVTALNTVPPCSCASDCP